MSKPEKIIPEKAIGTKSDPATSTINDRDSIVYALGIGFSQGTYLSNVDPLREEDYRYTIESDENFAPFPTYLTCANNVDLLSAFTNSPGIPEFNPFMILYAEERIELFKPLVSGL